MILVDTSLWIDYLRLPNGVLMRLLEAREILMHAFVIGEVSLGNLADREDTLRTLAELPQAAVADVKGVTRLIKRERLFGLGIGYVDVHLLASTRLAPGNLVWTRDRRLNAVADRLGIAAIPI